MKMILPFTHRVNILGSPEKKPITKELRLRDIGRHCMPFVLLDIKHCNMNYYSILIKLGCKFTMAAQTLRTDAI
jgi:hypothetical protein